ncbi:MAG: DUF1549 domain-containing protein, partial [Pirellulaceae bacterium]
MQSSPAIFTFVPRWSLVLVLFMTAVSQGQEPRDHWAFQSTKPVPLPQLANPVTARTPVDFFIQSRLSAQKLTLALPADRATWLRRATYDLIGLP